MPDTPGDAFKAALDRQKAAQDQARAVSREIAAQVEAERQTAAQNGSQT